MKKGEIENHQNAIISLLAEYCISKGNLSKETKSLFVEWFGKLYLLNTPLSSSLELFNGFIKTLSEEEFGLLVPSIAKILKRGPELVMKSIAYILNNINIDLTKYAQSDIYSNIIPYIKSSNEQLREESISALNQLVLKIKDVNVVEKIALDLLKLLKDKLPYPYERIGVISSLRGFSELLKKETLSTISSALLDMMETEGNDDVKVAGFTTVGLLLSNADQITIKQGKAVTSGLQSDKEHLRVAILNYLYNSISKTHSADKINMCKTHLPAISKILTAPPVKIAADAIYAARLALKLASIDKSVEDKLTADKLWVNSILKTDYPFYKESWQSKLKESDLIGLLSCFEIFIELHFAKLKQFSDIQVFYGTLITLLSNKSLNVRKQSANTLSKLVKLHPESTNELITSLKNSVFSHLETNEERGVFNTVTRYLPGLVTNKLNIGLFAVTLILVNHPFVDKNVLVRYKHHSINIQNLILQNINDICNTLNENLKHSNSLIVEATLRAYTEIAKIIPDKNKSEASTLLFNNLVNLLNSSFTKIKSLTPTELAIYHTPVGQLYQQVAVAKPTGPTPSSKDKGAQDKKKRGERGLYSVEDQKWEENLRKELEKKKGKEEADPEQKAKEELLKKEGAIRDSITQLLKTISTELTIPVRMMNGSKSLVHSGLTLLLPVITQFIKISIISESALSTYSSLSYCLQSSISELSLKLKNAIIYALKDLYATIQLSSKDELYNIIENILSDIMDACNSNALPAPTFTYIFPLIKVGIKYSWTPSVIENCVSLLEIHSEGDDYPRVPMMEISLTLLSKTTLLDVETRVKDIIVSLASGLQWNEESEELYNLNVLLKGLIDSKVSVRSASLQGLLSVPSVMNSKLTPNDTITSHFWFIKHDSSQENVVLGERLWSLYNVPMSNNYFEILYPFVSNKEYSVQDIAATSIAQAIKLFPDTLSNTIKKLVSIYTESIVEEDKLESTLHIRRGIAACLGSTSTLLTSSDVKSVLEFFLYKGLLDPSEVVLSRMEQAALEVTSEQGQTQHPVLLPIYESYLSKPSENKAQDRARESVVILLGTLAKHLGNENSDKVHSVVQKLITALKTPSESVQKAASKCIGPLMNLIGDKVESVINELIELLKSGQSYAERRGAAYGIAGIVKGLGISSLKKFNIMNILQEAVEDKKHPNTRQGALLAFECLCTTLERMFEPYVIQILPKLLVCYGDTVPEVRESTSDTAKAIMGQLSAHGVKLVLPALLKALDDRSWRTKTGSISLIGSMAFCAPKQLSSCLPTIVPRLSVVLTDTHTKVAESAREALGHIGSVIRNPEIQMHVPKLLKALDDPDLYTNESLEALIHTNFVHTIDAPSLSLIIPILHRGLKERSTDTKKKASQIVGNMCSLTDHKDLIPYLEMLIPDLKICLVDPIPEVRATSSKALGSLMQGMGEEQFPGLINWFMDTIKSDQGNVERSGAAQGLAEVLSGLPLQRFDDLLPEIISGTNHTKPHTREGYLGIFIFLPAALKSKFEPYLPQILPCILQGLSDDSESVREIAMRAGQSVVTQYSQSSLPILLPTLEDGLFNDNWRIRQSSINLLGELLYKVTGVKEGVEGEDTEKILLSTLGIERRNRVLAALYLIRSDVSAVVRQKGLLIWKSLVFNTPKALKEILPILMRLIIDNLGSSNFDKRQVASKTLGELVPKLGDKILPEIIPILESGLKSNSTDTKQGVCLGLSEIMASTSKAQLTNYMGDLVPAIRKALSDPLPEVREAAGGAFDMLYKNVGSTVLDDILPPLLDQLTVPESNAMEALKQILLVRSNVILPVLVPKLLTPPVTSFNIRALASIAEVAGSSLNTHLSTLIPAIINALLSDNNSEVIQGAETIILAVEEEGSKTLLLELIKILENGTSPMKCQAANLIAAYCSKSEEEIELNNVLDSLLQRFNDSDSTVLEASWNAVNTITTSIRKEQQNNYVMFLKNILETSKADLNKKQQSTLPGLCLPKGLQPLLPIFLNGLMTGTPEIREASAIALGLLIQLTSENTLKPFVLQITGPLIRIVGDRFPSNVKSAILSTLYLLIGKGGIMLKPFLPQLQTTFIKSLQDSSKNVRLLAANNLGTLMSLNTKVDPLITELLQGISNTSAEIQETMLTALQQVLNTAGKSVSSESLVKAVNVILSLTSSEEDSLRLLAAKSVGSLAKSVDPKQLDTIIEDQLTRVQSTWQQKTGYSVAIKYLIMNAPDALNRNIKSIVNVLLKYTTDEKVQVKQSSIDALGKVLLNTTDASILQQLLTQLSTLLNDPTNEVKLAALKVSKNFAKAQPQVL